MPGERILVADDEEDILDLCHRILAADGCKVSIANNGQEAIDAISTQAFDLLLTDVNMPGLTGLEASQVVKQINPNVIIVVMTAFATKETAIEALKLGVDEFVVKPFSPDELSLAVEKALEKERLRRENSRLQAMIPLFELNKLFMGQLTLSVLLPEVLAIAQREVKADFAGLFLMEEAGNLTFHGRNHLDETSDQALRSVGQSLAEEALLSQEPVTLGGPDPADRIGPVETLADWSVIVNPLVAKETSVGALMVAKRRASFAPSDGDFLAVLSSQVAIAIENARLFAEVQQAYEDLKVLDHMKSEFINIAAHELRTPLAILLGYASILGETTTGDEQNYVNIIIRNATRLRALIDDMLNMGYIETGKAQFRPDLVLLDEVVAEVMADMRLIAQEKSLRVISSITEDFPVLYTDRQKLELVLSNLLSNALKFTPEDGKITFDAEVVNGMAHVRVTDTGTGIPASELDKIFERFYQVEESLTRGHGGLGLGLAIVKGMVTMAGGEIWVESAIGEGSSFSLSVPLADG